MSSVSAITVKELREKTGAGMMDCKKALSETEGDMEKAVDLLRTKGLAAAKKKAGRATKEGLVFSYIHPGGKVGVMVEIACETDFVARTEQFQGFCKDVAMHIAAASPLSLSVDELSPEVLDREREIARQQALEAGKPENIVEKIVEGRISKYYQEVCLLEQAFVKDPAMTVKDLLDSIIGSLGENMAIRRFARFQLGEEL
ncbi:MAG: translation elongation factor Ts [Candidatus Krumholzibacteria bacterium]|jgi:elongation factor Ts|nr:translation elongation factor Ts [Candidatus Krumholzibacteria bacterium]MDP6669021.1 translation elongation factor Ts [Candidatus Krumholzibacteria bacterium]MDP6796540.1 translation elongation factor Ts [Candidatus Krumholzibacteria bacterium]MDP7021739.1 translation elongation factor Ts [Candidatus Krumholzibacteria bacterium]